MYQPLLCHSPEWVLVWCDEGNGPHQTGVPPITQQEGIRGWVRGRLEQGAVPQDPGVVDRTWITHKHINEAPCMVTNRLQLYRWKQFPVEIILAMGLSRGFDTNMAAVNGSHGPGKSPMPSQSGKTLRYLSLPLSSGR